MGGAQTGDGGGLLGAEGDGAGEFPLILYLTTAAFSDVDRVEALLDVKLFRRGDAGGAVRIGAGTVC